MGSRWVGGGAVMADCRLGRTSRGSPEPRSPSLRGEGVDAQQQRRVEKEKMNHGSRADGGNEASVLWVQRMER